MKYLIIAIRNIIGILQRLFYYLTFGQFPPPFVSSSAIIRDGNKILLIARKDGYGLSLPGGFLRLNEKVEDAARREVKEETGLDVEIKNIFTILSGKRKWTRIYSANIIYEAEIIGTTVLRNSYEGECKWIDLDDVHKFKIAFDYKEVLTLLTTFKQ